MIGAFTNPTYRSFRCFGCPCAHEDPPPAEESRKAEGEEKGGKDPLGPAVQGLRPRRTIRKIIPATKAIPKMSMILMGGKTGTSLSPCPAGRRLSGQAHANPVFVSGVVVRVGA